VSPAAGERAIEVRGDAGHGVRAGDEQQRARDVPERRPSASASAACTLQSPPL
jgi:hypothetical protein